MIFDYDMVISIELMRDEKKNHFASMTCKQI